MIDCFLKFVRVLEDLKPEPVDGSLVPVDEVQL